jgi:hypothetical protein
MRRQGRGEYNLFSTIRRVLDYDSCLRLQLEMLGKMEDLRVAPPPKLLMSVKEYYYYYYYYY